MVSGLFMVYVLMLGLMESILFTSFDIFFVHGFRFPFFIIHPAFRTSCPEALYCTRDKNVRKKFLSGQ